MRLQERMKSMRLSVLTLVVSTVSTLTLSATEFITIPDIAYADGGGASQVGDLYLPKKVTASTPIVLTIHGGAWAGGDRASWCGVSEFFAGQLGYAVFNIEYRLAEAGARWPACGDDCISAARYILSSEFKNKYGFAYDKIWICGGSAGGHLALWTLVNLPVNTVAGCVAISPIGDPTFDFAKHPSRYSALFDNAINLDVMNPCLRIIAGMAPVLITHATDDQVVPIESSKSFVKAYRAAGNQIDFFEYPCDLEPNGGGHCIWRPGSSPHRLINSLESKIAFFAKRSIASGEWTARTMVVSSVNRTAVGTVSSVDLQFGAGNGLANRLYLAYGETYGGDHMVNWSHTQFICEVTDEMSVLRVDVPPSRNYKFFMDVPFPDNQIGAPVKDVIGTGTQYIDTGVCLRGGDAIHARVKPTSDTGVIFGCRGANANDRNVVATFGNGRFIIDYNSSDYSPYRLTTVTPSGGNLNYWFDVVASSECRSVFDFARGIESANTEVCTDQFETDKSCRLFFATGQTSSAKKFTGNIALFKIIRDGKYVASYLPYKFGNVYGFFDRVTGTFFTAVEGSGEFLGTEDVSMSTPLTSCTETIRTSKATVEIPTRSISSCTLLKVDDKKYIDIVFGADNGLANKLYIAYDRLNRGENPFSWANLEYIGVVSSETNTYRVLVPQEAYHCRFFLSLPTEGTVLPVALGSIVGDGSGYFDTGFTIKGGDAIYARVKPTGDTGVIFGSRYSSADPNDRNVVATFSNGRFYIDYNSSNYSSYRLTTVVPSGGNLNYWFDIIASSVCRSVFDLARGIESTNTEMCMDQFETDKSCRLFFATGQTSSAKKFAGNIASFKIVREGGLLTSLSPCRIGDQYGFYDRVNARFLSATSGTFVGAEDADAMPLFSVSADIAIKDPGFIVSFK